MATKWPESVPVFTPSMICRNAYSRGPKRCASQWVYDIFYGSGALTVALNAVRAEAECFSILNWNDGSKTKDIADTLNSAMARLGYTEIVEVDA